MPSDSASPAASSPVIPEAEPQARLSGTSNGESNAARSRFGALLADGSHRPGIHGRDDGWKLPATLGAINPAQSERQEPAAGAGAAGIGKLVLPALPPARRRRRIAFKVAATTSVLLHASVLLAFVGWLRNPDAGAIPEPSEAVSIEMVASATLEALQPKEPSEPAPSPEATAPVEGATEASEVSAPKSEPPPEPQPVEPSPAVVPDAEDEASRAIQQGEPTEAPAPPPVEAPAEVVREPPKSKVPDKEDMQAKRKPVEKVERKARVRAPKGGTTAKARSGKGRGSSRASASRGAILTYAARVRARVASRPPSSAARGGTALVAFGLTPSGDLAYCRIARSSGDAAKDRIALAAVRRAAPFPRPPSGATSAQLRFKIPYYFD